MMRGLSQSGASARRVKAPGVDLEVIRRIIVNALLETPADLDPWILTDLVQGHIVSALRDEVLDFDPLLGDLLEIDGVTEETLYVGIVNVATTLASLGIYMEEPSLTLSDSERRQILQVGRAARHSAIAAYELRRLRAAITRARRKRLGQMLVEGQFITNAQLEDALAAQKRNGRRLGTNLIELGHVTAATLARFLGDQLEIPCVTWIGRIPDEVAGVVPKILAQRLRVLPLRLDENGALHLAMEDPLDIKAIDAVTKYTGRVVHPVVVPETVLLQALAKNYRLLSPSRLRATRDDEQE